MPASAVHGGNTSQKRSPKAAVCVFKRVKNLLSGELKALKDAGAIFVITCDEWSWQRKRYPGE